MSRCKSCRQSVSQRSTTSLALQSETLSSDSTCGFGFVEIPNLSGHMSTAHRFRFAVRRCHLGLKMRDFASVEQTGQHAFNTIRPNAHVKIASSFAFKCQKVECVYTASTALDLHQQTYAMQTCKMIEQRDMLTFET
eukprot:1230475-Amphidinium_carterae.2